MDRSVAFYRGVLRFVQVADREMSGDGIEHLYGVFGARIRVVTLKLGEETLKLEQFIAPQGRPLPADSKSNDRWFQHVAIIVADMDRAYARLRAKHVEFASTGPQLLPQWNPNAGGISAFYFRDPDGHDHGPLDFHFLHPFVPIFRSSRATISACACRTRDTASRKRRCRASSTPSRKARAMRRDPAPAWAWA